MGLGFGTGLGLDNIPKVDAACVQAGPDLISAKCELILMLSMLPMLPMLPMLLMLPKLAMLLMLHTVLMPRNQIMFTTNIPFPLLLSNLQTGEEDPDSPSPVITDYSDWRRGSRQCAQLTFPNS